MGNTKSKKGARDSIVQADNKAMEKLQWKLWNVMDMRSEKEMNELAAFLGSLRETVPVNSKATKLNKKYKARAAMEGQHLMMLALNDGDISLSNLQFEDLYDGIHMPENGVVTEEWVIDLMNSFRFDDKLLEKYAERILEFGIESFKAQRNVEYLNIPDGVTLTIIGDTHGQLHDLFHIFELNGLPSPTNWYLFNGDLVDRGTQAVEIILTLLAWKMVYPEAIRINRGNHEEYTICTVYGFKMEVIEKYSSEMFMLFLDFFGWLPLATVIQNKVLVLHGGLFCTDGMTLKDIEDLPRERYTGGVNEMSISDMQEDFLLFDTLPAEERAERIQMQRIRDVLWSDPCRAPGREESDRSAGCKFGPDVARAFLKKNNLALIIRSHEAVAEGYDWPYGSGKMLLTIFSATDYGGSRSSGAFVSFENNLAPRITTFGAHKDLRAHVTTKVKPAVLGDVTTVKATEAEDIDVRMARSSEPALLKGEKGGVGETNHKNLVQIIISVREELAKTFAELDTDNSGTVTADIWNRVMERITGLDVAWATLQPFLCDKDKDGKINYRAFLDRYQLRVDPNVLSKLGKSSRRRHSSTSRVSEDEAGAPKETTVPLVINEDAAKVNFDKLYGNRDQLLCIFRFFDVDCSGTISKTEFENGVRLLKKKKPEYALPSADVMWKMLDMDGNNEIDANEFLEVFRVVDTFTSSSPHEEMEYEE